MMDRRERIRQLMAEYPAEPPRPQPQPQPQPLPVLPPPPRRTQKKRRGAVKAPPLGSAFDPEYLRRLALREARRVEVRREAGYTVNPGGGVPHRTDQQRAHPEFDARVRGGRVLPKHSSSGR